MNADKTAAPLPRLPLWIDGAAQAAFAEGCAEVFDPARGEAIRLAPLCEAPDIERAVSAAARAFPGWRETTPLRRARILMRFRELLERDKAALARLVVEEHGKTLEDALGSVARGIEVVEFASGIPHLLKGEFAENVGGGIDCLSLRQPLGVCAGITPFNFPAMVPLWMFPLALACGNSFVLKPSEKVPSASLRMAELLAEAGLPPGVFNVVHGDAAAVDALIGHPLVRAVSFVGSTPVARHVQAACARAGKRVQALGGAKNHAVVLADADLDFAADAITGAAFGSAGERCMAISAVVAVGAAGDALVARLKERAVALRVGPGDAEGVDMGPLISAAHRARVAGFIEQGVREGAELVADGRRLEAAAGKGFFLGPTLFDRVRPQMATYREEIFGPLLCVLRATTLDEAIALANASPWGNGAAIFTRDGGAARRFQNEVEAGMVGINVPVPVPTAFFSFGGWKESLFGDLHVHGADGVRFYTRGKVVSSRWPAADATAPGLGMPTSG
ncbi:MAG TPA: CoA-acylating methylmalonate-semialdehyde dehydrogenase [Candidatus Desulfobacillus sp.]|nr:CoA-acylating methylmalonate-semialdehyde dehydrogenase [Candidatus Desulfobacillus sp.]